MLRNVVEGWRPGVKDAQRAHYKYLDVLSSAQPTAIQTGRTSPSHYKMITAVVGMFESGLMFFQNFGDLLLETTPQQSNHTRTSSTNIAQIIALQNRSAQSSALKIFSAAVLGDFTLNVL